jgi:hypothetical protein
MSADRHLPVLYLWDYYSSSFVSGTSFTNKTEFVWSSLSSGSMEYFNCPFTTSAFNPHYFLLCQIIFPFRFPIASDFLFHSWISSFSLQPLDTELRVGRGREVRDEVQSRGPPICSRKALISFLSPTRVAPLLHATQLIRKRSRWGMWECREGGGGMSPWGKSGRDTSWNQARAYYLFITRFNSLCQH